MGLIFIYIVEIMEPHNKEKQQFKVFAYFFLIKIAMKVWKNYTLFSQDVLL